MMQTLDRMVDHRWIPAGLGLVGLATGSFRIDHQSVWLDEAMELTFCRSPWGEMINLLIRDFVHPPLHYVLLWGWFGLFGFGTFQARLLSAVFVAGAGVMMYFLGRYLFSASVGVLAGVLLAVSQLTIMHAQEVRPYALLLFLVATTTYLCVRALRERNGRLWTGFVAVASLMIYAHYYAIMVLGCLLLYCMACRKTYSVPRWWVLAAIVVPVLVFAPWVLSGVVQEAAHSTRTFQKQPWLTAHWWSFFSIVNYFNNGKLFGVHGPSPWWVYLTGFVLFTLPAGAAAWFLLRKEAHSNGPVEGQGSLWLLGGLLVVPMVATVGVGLMGIPYHVRYVAHLVVPYYLLVAQGMRLAPARVSGLLVVAALAYSLVGLRSIYFIPYKENMKESLIELARDARPGDCAITLTGGLPHQWYIYVKDPPELKLVSMEQVESGQVSCPRIWLVGIRRVEQRAAIVDERRERLQARFHLADERRYFWYDVYLFVPRSPSVQTGEQPSNSGPGLSPP